MTDLEKWAREAQRLLKLTAREVSTLKQHAVTCGEHAAACPLPSFDIKRASRETLERLAMAVHNDTLPNQRTAISGSELGNALIYFRRECTEFTTQQLQCENCMLLQSEEHTVCVRNMLNNQVLCNPCVKVIHDEKKGK